MSAHLLGGLLGLVLLSTSAAPPALQLRIRPQVALAPSDVYIEIRLVPIATDRTLSVSAESVNFSRASAWTLDGEHAPRLFSFWWKQLEAGEYIVVAAVGDAAGHWRAQARTSLQFTGE